MCSVLSVPLTCYHCRLYDMLKVSRIAFLTSLFVLNKFSTVFASICILYYIIDREDTISFVEILVYEHYTDKRMQLDIGRWRTLNLMEITRYLYYIRERNINRNVLVYR